MSGKNNVNFDTEDIKWMYKLSWSAMNTLERIRKLLAPKLKNNANSKKGTYSL